MQGNAADRRYWDERIETMAPAELRQLEGPLIAEQIAYVYAMSPYYRGKFEAAGVQPDKVTCVEALETIPFTEKADITLAQRAGALFGPHQCAPFEDIVRIVATGGTSGQPTRIGWTASDAELYSEMGARALWANGCRPGDFVINCFNYSLYAGGIMDHMAFEHMGAGILPYGAGRSERLLDLLSNLPTHGVPGAYTLYSTPSYAIRLHGLAQTRRLDLKSLNFRKGIFSGEPGLQIPGYRAQVEEAWGMVAMDLYGAAEVGAQSGECEHQCGLHYGANGLVVAELIDPETGTVRRMESDAIGELVFTTLRRRACPLIRLRTHDTVRVFTEPCACGRTSFRFQTLGRSDDMFIVKGMNIFPLSVQESLLLLRPEVTGEFFVILDKAPPIDYPPRVCVEVAQDLPPGRFAALEHDLIAAIQARSNFTPALEFVRAGSIASEHKTRRLYRAYAGVARPSLDTINSRIDAGVHHEHRKQDDRERAVGDD
ncbi:MAG: phenylacetate--CoA ligase family protein [Steroidobacteraceae bacterium]